MPEETGSYAHDGVHKAIALARYARELRAWAADVQGRADRATGVDDWMLADQRGQHERESVPLVIPDRHADRFERLRSYLREEMEQVGDESIEQELELLETLCEEAPTTPREVQNR
jgi:Ca-activated chloride channel family protein